MNRNLFILIVLALTLIATSTWSIISYPRAKTVGRLKYPPGQRMVADRKRPGVALPAGAEVDSQTLRLDLLEERFPRFDGYRRNIFQPIFEDRETVMARKAAEAAARAAAEAKRALLLRQAVKPPPQPSRMQRELASFRFNGFVLNDGGQTVFLSKGDEVLVLRQGDSFAGKYVAASITDQALTIKATDTGEEIIIPVSDGRPVRR